MAEIDGDLRRAVADESAHVAALLSLPGMGPHRLSVVLAAAGGAALAWGALRGGARAEPVARRAIGLAELRGKREKLLAAWAGADVIEPTDVAERYRSAGVALVPYGSPRYPRRLLEDAEPPQLLFCQGDVDVLHHEVTAAIVGTRSATPYGERVASQWAAQLAELDVAVVSGLARGVDAAAHRGATGAPAAIAAPPIAVVGTGLDVIYPRSSERLWRAVAQRGVVLSEAPLGSAAERWRFPARNRVIAALADAVIVVESRLRGGSLSTAEAAADRGRAVLAVPGSVLAPTSAGTNRLITEGTAAAAGLDDVLDVLFGVGHRPSPSRPAGHRSAERGTGARSASTRSTVSAHVVSTDVVPDERERRLLGALGWEPASLDELVERTGWSLGVTCHVVEGLVQRHIIARDGQRLIYTGESCGD